MPLTAALALNLTGHLVGAALYAMLVALVVAPPHGAARPMHGPWWRGSTRLALLTGLLGFVWNLGALATDLYTLSALPAPPVVLAAAYAALGFLPAVVVYAVVRGEGRAPDGSGSTFAAAAVLLSTVAAVRHAYAAFRGLPVPDVSGLLWLTVGATTLLGLLLLWTRGRRGGGTLWILALAISAVSGFHLTGHSGGESWWIALAGHHASMPLAIAILQQEYRFAFADVFLKRALAMLVLASLMLGVWLLADSLLPLQRVRLDDPVTFAVLLALWLATSVTYPVVRRLASRIVDVYVLSRPDPSRQHASFIRQLAASTTEDEVLTVLRDAVQTMLNAKRVSIGIREDRAVREDEPLVSVPPFPEDARARLDDAVLIVLPTVRGAQLTVAVGQLQYGRRVWSDDLDQLYGFATTTSRRIDAIRDERRRLEQAVREQEVGRLAIEAELRAVRARLQPHFLFNALNTVRYLIDAAPARASTVLLQLTGVLRAVLRRSSDEFSTLGDELDLLQSYLAIEQARFESRLQLEVTVPDALRDVTMPALLLQPLVENAVRHGIAPLRQGGRILVTATADPQQHVLSLVVADTGAGAPAAAFRRDGGVGLSSVERRLALHYGDAGRLRIESTPGAGTTVCLTLPMDVDVGRARPGQAGWPQSLGREARAADPCPTSTEAVTVATSSGARR